MVPSIPIDLSAMLLAFGLPYAYFHLKVGDKMVVRPRWFAIFAAEFGAIMLLLAASWQLAANLVIWALVIVGLREF